jgi:hypothetical protein
MDWGGRQLALPTAARTPVAALPGTARRRAELGQYFRRPRPLPLKRDPGNRWAGVTILCARCENPILARARRNAVCCWVRRCGGFKLDKRGRKGAAQLRPCAVDRG